MPKNYLQCSVQELERAYRFALEKKKKAIQQVIELPTVDRTFQNVVLPLEETEGALSDISCAASLLNNVHTDKKVREACMKLEVTISNELRALYRNKNLYAALKDVAAKKEKLAIQDARLLHEMIVGEKLLGLDLSDAERSKLAEMQERLTMLSQEYSNAINQWRDSIKVAPQETDGLSKTFLSQLPKDKEGNYIVTLDYPSLVPFMQLSKVATKRKELSQKAAVHGGKENLQRLFEMVKLRHSIAKLLGYKNHAEMKLQLRMIQNDRNALNFVSDLAKKVRPKALAYVKELTKLKQKDFGKASKLGYYDTAFYANQYFQQKYEVDFEKLREFFPIKRVIEGTFKIYENLLGLKFKEKKNFFSWHPKVRLFEVFDAKTKEVIGEFYFDLHPREGKYTHACISPLVFARRERGKWVKPSCVMIANFTEPTPGNPGYLSHKEISTFFHEFGHIMHMVLSKVPHYSQSGFNVAWDFAEAPSQMLEYWMSEKRMLEKLAVVPKSKRKEYDLLVQKLLASEKVGSAHFVLVQLVYSQVDLNIHTKMPKDLEEMRMQYARVMKKFVGIEPYKKQMFVAGWGHMNGYDAGYYGYMWSRVIAVDMFEQFEKTGLDSQVLGLKYRKEILEKGASEAPEVLVKKFLGRKFHSTAFLKRLG